MKRLLVLLLLLTPGLLLAQVSHGGLSVRGDKGGAQGLQIPGNGGLSVRGASIPLTLSKNLQTRLDWRNFSGTNFWIESVTGQNIASAQNNVGYMPTKTASGVAFDGTSDNIRIKTPWFVSKSSVTVVLRGAIYSDYSGYLFDNYTTGEFGVFSVGAADARALYQMGGGNTYSSTSVYAWGVIKTYAFVLSPTSVTTYVDGAIVGTPVAHTTTARTISTVTLASRDVGTYPCKEFIKYFLIYDVVKTEAELLAIHNYLAALP